MMMTMLDVDILYDDEDDDDLIMLITMLDAAAWRLMFFCYPSNTPCLSSDTDAVPYMLVPWIILLHLVISI